MELELLETGALLKDVRELLQVADIDVLLERALTKIRSVVRADAGSIYLVENKKLRFSCTQNTTLQRKLPFGKKLIYSRFSIDINNRSISGYVAGSGAVINIPDVYAIHDAQPYHFDKKFDEVTGYRTQSVLTVPLFSVGKVIGVIQLINALNASGSIKEFSRSDEELAQSFADSIMPAITHAQLVRSLMLRMAKMVQLHDPRETVSHAMRVACYAVEIYEAWARKAGVPQREEQSAKDTLRMAAMFHDIGTIKLPDRLFQATDNLNAEDVRLREQHTIYGAQLFEEGSYSDFETMVQIIALNHHECWDGTGYPGVRDQTGRVHGKRGEEIPIYGRIVALAATYDNLLYRELNQEETPIPTLERKLRAANTISAGSGSKFDPQVVAAFVSVLDVINVIVDDYSEQKTVN